MIRKIVYGLVFIGLIYFVSTTYIENKEKSEQERVESQKEKAKIERNIALMAMKYKANTEWEKALSKNDSVRLGRILTVELEHEWINKGPIVFIGSIKDISSLNEKQYLVTIQYRLIGGPSTFIGSNLMLSLKSDKNMVDNLLNNHPELKENIKNGDTKNEEGETEDVKIGEGILLEIMYIGNANI